MAAITLSLSVAAFALVAAAFFLRRRVDVRGEQARERPHRLRRRAALGRAGQGGRVRDLYFDETRPGAGRNAGLSAGLTAGAARLGEVVRRQPEYLAGALGRVEPEEGRVGAGRLQRLAAHADFADDGAIRVQMRARLREDASHDVEAVVAAEMGEHGLLQAYSGGKAATAARVT